MDTWEFAIYKYSAERYDAEDWMFPGSQHGVLKLKLEYKGPCSSCDSSIVPHAKPGVVFMFPSG